jgi:hypothetical protein
LHTYFNPTAPQRRGKCNALGRSCDTQSNELTHPIKERSGTRLRCTNYHYWNHIGESQAIRQLLGHTGLPSFVGDIGGKAPNIPEARSETDF